MSIIQGSTGLPMKKGRGHPRRGDERSRSVSGKFIAKHKHPEEETVGVLRRCLRRAVLILNVYAILFWECNLVYRWSVRGVSNR
ncbi:hypothetical protein ACE6H2_019923 [Prunus campanulata]